MKRGEKLAREMSNFANTWSAEDIQDFINTMGNDHRTLQQSFTRLCAKWFLYLAEKEDGQYDLRNEASVNLAKKIKHILEYTSLPFI